MYTRLTIFVLAAGLSALVGFSSVAVAAEFEDGNAAFSRGDFATAAKWWRVAAEQGNAAAQYNVGKAYANGQGLPQNYSYAALWFEKAANQGLPQAQRHLDYIRKIVNQRMAAAEQGDVAARYDVMTLSASSSAAAVDYNAVYVWFSKAAEKGDADAQLGLGRLYENQHAVTRDLIVAYMWFSIAATKGDPLAQQEKDRLAAQMQAFELNYANSRVRRCVQSRYRYCG